VGFIFYLNGNIAVCCVFFCKKDDIVVDFSVAFGYFRITIVHIEDNEKVTSKESICSVTFSR
jgi:hypothetical protein